LGLDPQIPSIMGRDMFVVAGTRNPAKDNREHGLRGL